MASASDAEILGGIYLWKDCERLAVKAGLSMELETGRETLQITIYNAVHQPRKSFTSLHTLQAFLQGAAFGSEYRAS